MLASVFGVALAGLVYELVAGTLSTYLLGASVTVFSLVIGWFLFAMGMGAFVAQYVPERHEARAFVVAEIAVAAVGGTSALALFTAFAVVGEGYVFVLALVTLAVGALVGVEIPLILRILKQHVDLRIAVSHVLALDYLGALAGSIAFPLVLLPWLGAVRAAALLGLLNVGVAWMAIAVLRRGIPDWKPWTAASGAIAVGLFGVLVTGAGTTRWLEDQLYQDEVIFAADTGYQRMVVTRWHDDVRLYLNGNLQFSSIDEYRYHEALVLPPLLATRAERVLILGGGDGLAVRRVLDFADPRVVDLVDLDPAVTRIFTENSALAALSGGALADPRVVVHHEDAVKFLERTTDRYDVVILDLPDPNDADLARLYAVSTYRLALRRLRDGGALVTQATSPYYAPEAFWCIVATLEEAVQDGPVARSVHASHVQVPSFGEWGFAVVMPAGVDPATLPVPAGTRFLDAPALAAMWTFPRDMQRRPVEVNRLGDAVLAKYYKRGWTHYRQ
ncbi:MAG: polyamine aminopropyltransferase [Alphaproteobacteria bacterium]|nr:polyamine aminopropyltransferase [Alphaproteobacteria bacterium]